MNGWYLCCRNIGIFFKRIVEFFKKKVLFRDFPSLLLWLRAGLQLRWSEAWAGLVLWYVAVRPL